jgi:prepilin-type N-terminal cleavage/methylation domain-containing protein
MKIKRGFTIIEVIVVIGIIAILTAIILPSINNIRKKNRDTERVADISAIQLGLSLYYSQNSGLGYTQNLDILVADKYITSDTQNPPTSDPKYNYKYVPLKKGNGSKCTFYHLGTELEMGSEQIDTTDQFNSMPIGTPEKTKTGSYDYCGVNSSLGFDGTNIPDLIMFDVHP